jgi:hypothetical protein
VIECLSCCNNPSRTTVVHSISTDTRTDVQMTRNLQSNAYSNSINKGASRLPVPLVPCARQLPSLSDLKLIDLCFGKIRSISLDEGLTGSRRHGGRLGLHC